METVEIKVTKFKTKDGALFDNVEGAKRWEEMCKKKELASKVSKCIYDIGHYSFIERNLPCLGREVEFKLVHPLTEEDIEILEAYLDVWSDDEASVHRCPKKFEIEKDYIMVYSAYDMYVFEPDELKKDIIAEAESTFDCLNDDISLEYTFKISKKRNELIMEENKKKKGE